MEYLITNRMAGYAQLTTIGIPNYTFGISNIRAIRMFGIKLARQCYPHAPGK
jgi:hypothetical protein